MNPYERYVQQIADLIRAGKELPLGGFPDYPRPVRPGAPTALIFSPHPDDEVVIGGWALRLLRQSGWRIVNVAVTQGSSKPRQKERWEELTACCKCIGFDLEPTGPHGLEQVNPKTRSKAPDDWRAMVHTISNVLTKFQPRAIFFPHGADWNSTHVGTHLLVADALASQPASFTCSTIETEYWAQMSAPNVLIESSAADLSALITALSWHAGEVRRNPYHLTMPAWMIDNVRRGAEWIGGQGKAAPDFLFGTIYRLRRWSAGAFEDVRLASGFIAADQDPAKDL